MYQLVGYHRPESISDTIGLLEAPDRIILAGGTTIRHGVGGPRAELVDIQSLGLDRIDAANDTVTLGAMLSLQAVIDDKRCPTGIREAAATELPSTLRALATVGGTVAAMDQTSILLATLLVSGAVVRFADDREVPLPSVLDGGLRPADLIVSVTTAADGPISVAKTGRTPADAPIVAVVGRSHRAGMTLAACGIASTPVLLDPNSIDDLAPPADFRGSADYRRHLTKTLVARVSRELS